MWSPEVKVGCHSSGTTYLDFWDRTFFSFTWNSLSKQVGPWFLKIHCLTSPVLAPRLPSVCRCGEGGQTWIFMLSQNEALFWLSYELFSQDHQNTLRISVFGTNIWISTTTSEALLTFARYSLIHIVLNMGTSLKFTNVKCFFFFNQSSVIFVLLSPRFISQ